MRASYCLKCLVLHAILSSLKANERPKSEEPVVLIYADECLSLALTDHAQVSCIFPNSSMVDFSWSYQQVVVTRALPFHKIKQARELRRTGKWANELQRERTPMVYFYSRGAKEVHNRGAEVFHQLHEAGKLFSFPQAKRASNPCEIYAYMHMHICVHIHTYKQCARKGWFLFWKME